MGFKSRDAKNAYQRALRKQSTPEQRARERARCARYRAANREQLREYDKKRHVVHEIKRNVLREPQGIAARAAALRWDRLQSAGYDARRAEAIADAHDMQYRLLSEVWWADRLEREAQRAGRRSRSRRNFITVAAGSQHE